MLKPCLLLCCLLFSGALMAEELTPDQPSPEEMAKELGVQLPRLPWHLTDIWWEFAESTPKFESLSVEITIDRDIPDTYNLYVSPVGIAQINGQDFYGGLQTNVNGWVNKESRERVHPGKGAIFSRWSRDKKKTIGLEHVRLMTDGLCESAGYEGEFCSVRRPYQWTKGSYTWSVVKGDSETVGDHVETWFHCLVRNHQTNVTTFIGSLRFEGEEFTFWNRNAAFVEVYSTSKIPRSGIPKVKVTFGYPLINGRKPPLKSCRAQYNIKSSPQCAKASVEGESITIEVGGLFERADNTEPLPLKIAGQPEPAEPSRDVPKGSD